MSRRRQVTTDTEFLSGKLSVQWRGFWALFFRGPAGFGMTLWRGISLAAVLALVGSTAGLSVLGISVGIARRDPGKVIGGALALLLLAPIAFKLALLISGFLLEALNLKRVLANFTVDLAEGARAERLARYRAERAEQIAAERAKSEPAPQPEATPEAPTPRPWYRPEPPPGSSLGPRRLDDIDPP